MDLLGNAASSAGRMWSVTRQYPLAKLAAGKTTDAYEDLLKQREAYPYRAETWRMLAQVAEQLGQPKIAARAYAEAANRDVRDDESRARLRELRSSF